MSSRSGLFGFLKNRQNGRKNVSKRAYSTHLPPPQPKQEEFSIPSLFEPLSVHAVTDDSMDHQNVFRTYSSSRLYHGDAGNRHHTPFRRSDYLERPEKEGMMRSSYLPPSHVMEAPLSSHRPMTMQYAPPPLPARQQYGQRHPPPPGKNLG